MRPRCLAFIDHQTIQVQMNPIFQKSGATKTLLPLYNEEARISLKCPPSTHIEMIEYGEDHETRPL